jgi:hypothetical protein
MKNQNDLIFTIVAIIVALGALAGTYFTKPEPQTRAEPEKVKTSDPVYPTGSVTYSASLPGASNQHGGPGAGMGMTSAPAAPSGGQSSAPAGPVRQNFK